MHPTIPAAASPLTLDLVAGPSQQAVVLAAFPTALYLGRPEHAKVLPVVTRDALILPTALRLAEPGPHDWGVDAGDVVTLGGGLVALPGHGIRVVRSWRPRRVTIGSPSAVTVDWTSLLAQVGRGEGLTPRADDVLCGALLAARALGVSLPATLPVERTTSLSASLLEAAHAGYAVPAVIDHVTAVVAGSADTTSTREAVLAIGHTSGAGLLEGIDLVRNTSHCPLPEGIPS
ncbi:oxamate carbamoyltransferase subunit AllH family protein [Knoellia sp. Soil729]|uniref:oxamate carbamoyltransferase subunit AllH family protein n=1 Tax=Knoellia sp. Soil729 TaxID=1736394 RepID=UPI0006FBAD3A|nr:DUF2877 domain-containing protein [Knoellia sp. Soil729]KRE43828.1 hypothetical protein ASG74_03040 [Knoellia sp. Soil729]